MAVSEASPRLTGPLEEAAPMAASAPKLSQGAGPPAALAPALELHDSEVVDAPEEQLPTAGGTPRRRRAAWPALFIHVGLRWVPCMLLLFSHIVPHDLPDVAEARIFPARHTQSHTSSSICIDSV